MSAYSVWTLLLVLAVAAIVALNRYVRKLKAELDDDERKELEDFVDHEGKIY